MNKKQKVVVFTGAGISVESGLKTFRDNNGLWCNHKVEDVATPEAFKRNPKLVLDFYNYRREEAAKAKPNAAHRSIAELEQKYDVTVITQNVDDLHERGGSSDVIHLHGLLTKACSSLDKSLISDIGAKSIHLGDRAKDGSQLRPFIVWFGEEVPLMEKAMLETEKADIFIVIGTSLAVYPAANLLYYTTPKSDKYIVSLDCEFIPDDFVFYKERASIAIPRLIATLMK